MGVGGNDAVTAKDAVETANGDNGVPWIGGQAGAPGSRCWNYRRHRQGRLQHQYESSDHDGRSGASCIGRPA